MERRQILYLPNPARFTFYIHENGLRQPVGDDRIMHEQLLHVVLTAGLDNVTVRIVPSVAGAFGEALHLMEFQDCRPTVYLGDLQCGGLAQTSWRKSSYSGGGGTNCVEAAWNRQPPSTSSGVLVRDSKNPAAPVLTIPTTAWRQLLASGGGS